MGQESCMLKTQLDRVLLLGCFVLSVAFYGTHFFKIVYFQFFLGELPLDWNDVNHNWFATYSNVISLIWENTSYSPMVTVFVVIALLIIHAACTLLPFFVLRSVVRWIKKGQ
jgi:hypothetical protein